MNGIAAFALCLLPLVLALAPSPARAALLSRSAEISMGREAAQEYERTESIDADPVLAARVRRIGQRLIAVGAPTEYPFEFHEVETNEINAFALPGGFVYVYRGLAQLLPGDDALAFVLAHETSHVTERHGVRQIEKSLAIGAVLDFAVRRSTASGILQLVLDMHFSRHDEAEADRLGLERMARAGFDPTQGAEAMAVVARVANSSHSLPPLLRSHPLPESRVASLRKEAETLRAQPRPARDVVAAPPLPAPQEPAPPPAAAQPSELFPLTAGMSWTYRLMGAPERRTTTTTVLEEYPGLAGVFRVRTELDAGLAADRLVTVTAAAVCALPLPLPVSLGAAASTLDTQRSTLPPGAWRVEIPLPANLAIDKTAVTWETVRVPAGDFRALRVSQRAPGGTEAATVWLAPGVGIVRRAWRRTGLVEELESLSRPAPEKDDSSDGAKTGHA